MDILVASVIKLHEQGYAIAQIAHRLKVSDQKVLRILVTYGFEETDESKLFNQGYTVQEIAILLGKEVKSVSQRLPYTKGMYMADYPSVNALRVRATRKKKDGKDC